MAKIFMFKAYDETRYADQQIFGCDGPINPNDIKAIYRARLNCKDANFPYLAILPSTVNSSALSFIIPRQYGGCMIGSLNDEQFNLNTPEGLAKYLHQETTIKTESEDGLSNKQLKFMVDYSNSDYLMDNAANLLKTKYGHEVILKELDTTLKQLHIFQIHKDYRTLFNESFESNDQDELINKIQSINPELDPPYLVLFNETENKQQEKFLPSAYCMNPHRFNVMELLFQNINTPANLASLIHKETTKEKINSPKSIKGIIQVKNHPFFEEAYRLLRTQYKIPTVTKNI